ncbi:MAG: hypothetical protein AAGF06_06415 [Pseudomonadota bacterium]
MVGFSTLNIYKFNSDNGKSRLGLFSGDTIVEKEYWGKSFALQASFVKYCLKFLIKNPFAEKYWLLISKGYKMYMLLAKKFVDYYPHPHRNEQMKPMIKDYCETLFPGYYNESQGILYFGDNYQSLKGGVAEIDDGLKSANSRISFFDEKNPN